MIPLPCADYFQHHSDEQLRLNDVDDVCVTGFIRMISRLSGLHYEPLHAHQERVANLSRTIAMEMGLSAADQILIYLAAQVHDIGLTAVPEEILELPRALSEAEFETVKSHSLVGADIFYADRQCKTLRSIIAQHHENVDGSGYPHGIGSDEILIEAKIIALADTYDVMRSWTPYQPEISKEVAIETISDLSGKKLAPDVVRAFIKCTELGLV